MMSDNTTDGRALEVPCRIPDDGDIEGLAERLEGATAAQILRWAWQTFGDGCVATSSFQTQSVPLLHLIGSTVPQLEVVFLDTGFHFPETLAFRDRLEERLGLNLRSVTAEMGHEAFRAKYGKLFSKDPDLCCHINKVEPLERVMEGAEAWISGIRRDQTKARAGTPVIEERSDGTYKICPMVRWTAEDIADYRDRWDLPEHPLTEQGYTSIGCAPCTECPSSESEDREGRWPGRDKTECGLHVDSGGDDDDGPPSTVSLDGES